MTKEKKAQKGSKGKGANLKTRAAEVIEDVQGFDADTRRAVWLALANLKFAETNPRPATKYTDAGYCELALRNAIGKAERGEPAFDVDAFGARYVEQARAVYAITEGTEGESLPGFIVDAVMITLEEAARAFGVKIWLDVDGSGDAELGGYSVAALANLFERVGVGGPEVEPKHDLAGHVAAVLKHPDTPSELYDAMRPVIARMGEPEEFNTHPDVLRLMLKVYAEEKGGE